MMAMSGLRRRVGVANSVPKVGRMISAKCLSQMMLGSLCHVLDVSDL